MPDVFDLLDKLGIQYRVLEHPAVFTVHDAALVRKDVEFAETKNLFLRTKKGDAHYLVSIPAHKQLDMKLLSDRIGERLSFASEDRLMRYLGLTRGSVSPFGLLHDKDKQVVFVLDQTLLDSALIGFHPNCNTQTVVFATADLQKYLAATGHRVLIEAL